MAIGIVKTNNLTGIRYGANKSPIKLRFSVIKIGQAKN